MTDHPSAKPPLLLIVEDEMLVRIYAVDYLQDAGFQVLEAGDAVEAITLLSGADQVLAAIVGTGLRGSSSDQLVAEMRARRQALPIVITSGLSGRELKDRFASDPRVGVLVKPYTPSMLIGALNSLGVKAPNPDG